jgi:hypothetical protein
LDRGHPLTAGAARAIEIGRRHRVVVIVVVAGIALRVAVAVAYRPAIFYNDSFVYLRHAYNAGGSGLVTFAPDRPAGYPLILHLLGESIAWTTTLQHLAGLATGVLIYVLLLRLSVSRALAAATTAVILMDAYVVNLEQLVLAEPFFSLCLTASAVLVISSNSRLTLAAGFALLAGACLLRNSGYFLILPWLAFVTLRHRAAPQMVAAAAIGLVLPWTAYAIWQHSAIGRWTPYATNASGWFLYSRVADFGGCGGLTVSPEWAGLCRYQPQDLGQGPEYYLFSGGPARRMFPDEYPGGGPNPTATNRVLRDYAVTVIKAHPFDYLGASLLDFAKFFAPGVRAQGDDDETFHLRDEGRSRGGAGPLATPYFYNLGSASRAPGHPYRPGEELRSYQAVFHTQRWLLAICALAALLVAVLRRLGRAAELPERPEQLILVGGPVLAFLGQAATAQFALRYELPFVGLLLAGGAVALTDLLALSGRASTASPAPASRA